MLNNPITELQIPSLIARDTEFQAADAAHIAAQDPHLQYATQARGDARYARQYNQYFRAAPSVSQPLSQNVVTKINFDTVTSNVGSQYSAINHRIIAVETEVWRITTAIEFNLPTSSRVLLWLSKNGGNTLVQLLDATIAGFYGQAITPGEILLLPTDYLEVWTRIYNISTGSIYGDPTLRTCWWEGRRVG
jgi:hypothetical protein